MSSSESDEIGPTIVNPPPVVVEPEAPDPFIIDDPESLSSEENSTDVNSSQPSYAQSPTAAEEISLAQSSLAFVPPLPSPTLPEERNNPLPPLPPSKDNPSALDSEDSDEEIPDLYIPALTNPTMFLPIPNVRLSLFNPLTWWLSKSLINYSCIIRQIR
jgi:hypothetical protein